MSEKENPGLGEAEGFGEGRFAPTPEQSHHQAEKASQDIEDRPERVLGWLYNPSAPATNEDLKKFVRTVAEPLDQLERGAAK